MKTLGVATMLFVSALALQGQLVGCGKGGASEHAGRDDEKVQPKGEAPVLNLVLGQQMPDVTAHYNVEVRPYSSRYSTFAISDVPLVRIRTPEGKTVEASAALLHVRVMKGGEVASASMWALPRPMPFKEGVQWLADWQKANEVDLGGAMREDIDRWMRNEYGDVDDDRSMRLQIFEGYDEFTPTTALEVRWKPRRGRDWKLVLGVSLNVEEIMKISKERERREREGEEREGQPDEPTGPGRV